MSEAHTENNMSQNSDFHLNPTELVQTLRSYWKWWAIPAVACAVVAAAYSLVAPRDWRASQTLTLRPEAASVSEQRLGKFADLSEMKSNRPRSSSLLRARASSKRLKSVG
jgi:uncharacterized protein involved in exopolysaccharide biosynthesis